MQQIMSELQPGNHACFLYETPEEHRTTITSFVNKGINNEEKIVYIAEENSPGLIKQQLADGIPGLDNFLKSGQLEIKNPDKALLLKNGFNLQSLMYYLKRKTEKALAEGFSALRITPETSWVMPLPYIDPLVECETKINKFFESYSCLALCQYNRSNFTPGVLLKILRAHPLICMNDEVYQNIYYMPPEKYIKKIPLNYHNYNEKNYYKTIEEELCEIRIENLREKLNEVFNQGYDISHPHIICLSKKLDKHINRYFETVNT